MEKLILKKALIFANQRCQMFNNDVDIYDEYVYRKSILKELKEFKRKYDYILNRPYQEIVEKLFVILENDLSDLECKLWEMNLCKECGSELSLIVEKETNAKITKCPTCGYVED